MKGKLLFAIFIASTAAAFASDPARAFVASGTFAIDWDIAFTIPPGWPPIPASGGPGLRFSPTDDLAVGFQIHVTPFFMGGFDSDLFLAWRFWNPDFLPLSLSGTTVFCFSKAANAPLRISPQAGLCLGFGKGPVEGYIAGDVIMWFPDASIPPMFTAVARLGVVFPSLASLSVELSMIDVGQYSSVTRTWLGQPIVSIGMINSF